MFRIAVVSFWVVRSSLRPLYCRCLRPGLGVSSLLTEPNF